LSASAERRNETQLTLRERLAAMTSRATEHETPSAQALAQLSPIFADHLALGARAYEEAWELADILVLVEHVNALPPFGERLTRLTVARVVQHSAEERMDHAVEAGDPDEHDDASEALGKARREAERALGAIADLADAPGAHIRFSSRISERVAAPAAERVLADVQREGASHPLLRAGFAAGNQASLEAILEAISLQVGRIGHERAQQAVLALPGRSGAVPTYLWIDTGERPRF